MSKSIDEKVVEMRFDNQHFEKNVSTTMSTLEKLKRSLKLEGASKGLEEVNAASKKIDFSKIENTACQAGFHIQDVWLKLSNVLEYQVAGKLISIAKDITTAFTIDPIKSGFQEYETQINAVQTILANTSSKGTTLDHVNAALDELNHYADKTIYNFTEMTRNIGTFTAAGVDLETSVNAIQGIANLAAVSGSTSQQASTAMYQLSQALAAGTVKLVDWNSVVNAGMGGEVFQNALKKTSELLGTGAEAAIKANGSFRESLKTGWLTSEVLTETLKKFTTSGANEYVAEYCGISAEAVQAALDSAEAQYGEADAIDKAAQALAEKTGKNKDEIKSALEMARTAEDAATKVKTFSQLMDTLKEAVQSGWTQTWKIIIGDFEEAKAMFTKVSDTLGGVIQKFSDARNNVLEAAFGSKWDVFAKKVEAVGIPLDTFKEKLVDVAKQNGIAIDDLIAKHGSLEKVITSERSMGFVLVETLKSFAGAGKEASATTEDMTDKLEYFQKVVDEVWHGDYGNMQERWDALSEAGYDYVKVQDLVNKTVDGHRLTLEDLGEEQLKNIGYTDEEIVKIRQLAHAASVSGTSINDLIQQITRPTGRELMLDSFANAFKGLTKVLQTVKKSWDEIFPPKTTEQKAESLYHLLDVIHGFSEKLIMSDETAKNLKRTLNGLFAILDLMKTVVGGGLSAAIKLVNAVLAEFNLNILDVTAVIGDALVGIRDFVKEHDVLGKTLTFLVGLLIKAGTAISEWAKNSETVQKVLSDINKLFESSKKSIEDWINGFDNVKDIPKFIFEGLYNGLQSGISKIAPIAMEIGKAIINKVREVLGIHSPSTEFFAIGEYIIEGLINGIQNGLSKLGETVKSIGTSIINIVKKIDWGAIFAAGISAGLTATLYKMAKAIESFTNPLGNLGDLIGTVSDTIIKLQKSFKSFINASAFEKRSKAIRNFAISIAILAASVALLTLVDQTKLENTVKTIGALGIILGVLAFAMSEMSSDIATIGKGVIKINSVIPKLIGISVALLILAGVIKIVGSMDPTQAEVGFKRLSDMIVAMSAFLAVYGLLVKGKSAQNINKLGSMLKKLSISLLLLVVVTKLVGKLTPDEMLKGLAFVATFTLFVQVLTEVTSGAGKNVDKLGSMLLKLSVSMILLIAVVKLAGTLSLDEMLNGLAFVATFTLFVWALVQVTKDAGKDIPKLGGLLLSISASMLIMAGIVKIVGGMSYEAMLKGGAAILTFAFIMTVMVKTIGDIGPEVPKLSLTLLAMSGAIAIMAATSIMLSFVSLPALAKGVVAVGFLSLIMDGMLLATKNAKDCKGNLIVMTVAIGVLAVAIAALSFIDPTKLAGATIALFTLMGMFALMELAAKSANGSIGTLITMTVAVGILGGILYLIAQLPIENALSAAAALGVLLLSMSASLFIVSNAGSISKKAAASLIGISVAIGILAGLLYLLAQLPIEKALSGAVSLMALSVALVAIAAATNIMPKNLISVSIGLMAVSAALIILSVALNNMGKMSWDEIARGLVALGGSLAILAIGLNVMNGTLAGSAALLIASAALTILAGVLTTLGGMSWDEIARGLVALAGSFAVIGVAGLVLGPLTPIILALSAAITLLGIGVTSCGAGLLMFATALSELSVSGVAGVSALTTAIKAIIMLIPQLAIMVAQGIIQMIATIGNGAATIATAIIQIGNAILDTIVTLIPRIVEVALTLIDSFLSSIAEHLPSIVQSGWSILISFLQGIRDNIGEMVNVVSDIIINFLNALGLRMPDIIQAGIDFIFNFIEGLGQGIENNAARLRECMWNLCKHLWNAFCEFFGIHSPSRKFAEAGGYLIEGLINGIGGLAGAAASKMVELGSKLVAAIGSKVGEFRAKGSELISNMQTGISNKISDVRSAIATVVSNAVQTIASKVGEFRAKGSELMSNMRSGISSKLSDVKLAASNIVNGALNSIREKVSSFRTIGTNMISGLTEGIQSMAHNVVNAAKGVVSDAVDAAKNLLGIHSPSRVFAEIGRYTDEGFVQGLNAYASKVSNASKNVGQSAVDGITNAISGIGALDGNLDVEPSIRPVLDMSSIGMTNLKLGAGLETSFTKPTDTLSRVIQNAQDSIIDSNDEVIAAIYDLKSAINNMGETSQNNTFNINSTDPMGAADEVSRILQQQVERRGAVWA